MNSTLGRNVTNRRHEINMTQEQLAELSNLSINYISKIERGSATKISAKTLHQLSIGLNTSMENLLAENPAHTNHIGPYQRELLNYLQQYEIDKAELISKNILNILRNS